MSPEHPRTDRSVSTRIGARDISKNYGLVQANNGVSFNVTPGQIHAVVGENGAGKSTLMRILQGLEKPDSGTVILNDDPVQLRDPQQAIRLGIGMVHQEFMLAPELTLLENLVLGDEPMRTIAGPIAIVDWKKALTEARALEKRAGVAIDWDRPTATAPVHIQQYVEILRLLRRGNDVLILDEPTAVLAPQQVSKLIALLKQLRDQGASIIFISHKLHEVVALADHVTIMRRGKAVASASVDELDIAAMTRHIMGDAPADPSEQARAAVVLPDARRILCVEGLCAVTLDRSQALNNISMDVFQGEIVGIAGVAGNGQEELMECLAGLRSMSSGSISLNGAELAGKENMDFRLAGIGYVSPDRAHEGLARLASIADNVMAGSQHAPAFLKGPFRNLPAVGRAARQRLANLDVRYGALSDPVSSLSGGNQQKLVFARETASKPQVLIVSQPTRGVDLNGIAAIHAILRQHCEGGGCVVLASEELDELIALCDRILVLSEGRMVGAVRNEDATPETIGKLMLASGDGLEMAHV